MTDEALTAAEQAARDLTWAVMRHYGYTEKEISDAEAVHPGRACDPDACSNDSGGSIHGAAHVDLHVTASLVIDVVLPWHDARVREHTAADRQSAQAEALREAARALPGCDGIRTHGDAARWLRDRAERLHPKPAPDGGER